MENRLVKEACLAASSNLFSTGLSCVFLLLSSLISIFPFEALEAATREIALGGEKPGPCISRHGRSQRTRESENHEGWKRPLRS